jgi:hypothetical protein
MIDKSYIQQQFESLFLQLPDSLKEILRVEYLQSPHYSEAADFIIYKEKELMALGCFEKKAADSQTLAANEYFLKRISLLPQGNQPRPHYLVTFDGDQIILNDLDSRVSTDEYIDSFALAMQQIATDPNVWNASMSKLQKMKLFLHELDKLTDSDRTHLF